MKLFTKAVNHIMKKELFDTYELRFWPNLTKPYIRMKNIMEFMNGSEQNYFQKKLFSLSK
jgi:hypothetical protein